MDLETRYLIKRENYWHYSRRVPIIFQNIDRRKRVRLSLRTRSIIIARERRDALERADNAYWSGLLGLVTKAHSDAEPFEALILQRYKMEQLQAISLQVNSGFSPTDHSLSASLTMSSPLLELIKTISQPQAFASIDAPPPARTTEAFELYCNKIAFRDLINKSPQQKNVGSHLAEPPSITS